jgi:hypothetical protein
MLIAAVINEEPTLHLKRSILERIEAYTKESWWNGHNTAAEDFKKKQSTTTEPPTTVQFPNADQYIDEGCIHHPTRAVWYTVDDIQLCKECTDDLSSNHTKDPPTPRELLKLVAHLRESAFLCGTYTQDPQKSAQTTEKKEKMMERIERRLSARLLLRIFHQQIDPSIKETNEPK